MTIKKGIDKHNQLHRSAAEDAITEEENKRYGRKFLFVILAFFFTFATVDAYFVYSASRTHTGTIMENTYERGLNYNKTLDALEKQNQLQWSGSLDYKNGELVYVLSQKSGAPITGALVKMEITRPTHIGYDFEVALTENKSGQYSAKSEFPLKGQWDIRSYVVWQDKLYQKSERIFVK